jgi:flagellar assembly factor FliW
LIIETKYFGKMEIDKNKNIYFPKGIPAFDHIREFVLLSFPDNDIYFCLQSVKKPEIAFILISPWDFFSDYDFRIPQDDLAELGIEKQEQVQVYNIITIPHDPKDMTANLMAPIVINTFNRRGKQIVLYESEYGTKHPLLRKEAV